MGWVGGRKDGGGGVIKRSWFGSCKVNVIDLRRRGWGRFVKRSWVGRGGDLYFWFRHY